jgi:hypothetical protein
MNTDVKKFAQKVLDNVSYSKDPNYGVDPITIILVISVILTLIRVIQECRKNKVDKKELTDIISKDNMWTRWRVQKVLRQHLSAAQYKEYGKVLKQSLKDAALTLTDDEVSQLMGSVP